MNNHWRRLQTATASTLLDMAFSKRWVPRAPLVLALCRVPLRRVCNAVEARLSNDTVASGTGTRTRADSSPDITTDIGNVIDLRSDTITKPCITANCQLPAPLPSPQSIFLCTI